jgi:hypothetical protein
MVNRGVCVDNSMSAYPHVVIDTGTPAYYRTLAYLGIIGYLCVLGNRPDEWHHVKVFCYHPAPFIIPNADNNIHGDGNVLAVLGKAFLFDNRYAVGFQYFFYHPGMFTGAYDGHFLPQ